MTTDSLTALITGGTSGIGRATAKKLAKLGIPVIVVGRNAKRGDETLAEIRAAGGKADFIASDLRNASSAREVAKRAVELGSGHVDILINNAGRLDARRREGLEKWHGRHSRQACPNRRPAKASSLSHHS